MATISFEFFPPRTPEGAAKLRNVRAELAALHPEYFSVTFGAGGSTREGTWNTVLEIHGEGLPVAAHISCIGTTRASVQALLAG
ncbi:MAG: methylenetetrahydrofolate reductase, partial [Pseudomonadota bacterium]|nr:methylenetetrahydrofolate reductase [Pseudomonadota bacterium]